MAPATKKNTPRLRLPLYVLIREVLLLHGGEIDVTDMVGELEDRKADLGKYPLRTVISCLSSATLKWMFQVTRRADGSQTVKLKDRTIRYTRRSAA